MYDEDLLMIHICMRHTSNKDELVVVHNHVIVDHANHEVFQQIINVHLKEMNDSYSIRLKEFDYFIDENNECKLV